MDDKDVAKVIASIRNLPKVAEVAFEKVAAATPKPWAVMKVGDQLGIANVEEKFLVAVLHPDDTEKEPGPSNGCVHEDGVRTGPERTGRRVVAARKTVTA